MTVVKLYLFPIISIILCLSAALPAVGQFCVYTNRELLFDDTKDHMQVMLSPDGNTHVWRWGPGRVTRDVYDRQLHFVENQVVSRHAERLLFADFKSRYYVLLMESRTTRVVCIQNDTLTDRTTDFNNVPTEEMPVSQIRQGTDQWFFIQYGPADDAEHSMMHIAVVDSDLHYINSVHLTLRYTLEQLRKLRLYTSGNELLFINTSISDSTMKLTVHKLNTTRGTLLSNSFLFEDELFVLQDVLSYKAGFVLQGQAYRPLSPPRRQTAYTYLLQIDSSLRQISSYHTALADSTLAEDMMYWYLPVSTTLLSDNRLLIADYQRNLSRKTSDWEIARLLMRMPPDAEQNLNRKTTATEAHLRFHQLDSGFTVLNSSVQLTKDYSNYPSLVFGNGPQVQIFYEEMIKSNRAVVHHYRLGEDDSTDRLLPLNPKNYYVLKNAIRTGKTSFIMPYLRNYKLGLVRINIPAEE